MSSLPTLFWVALGGALGASARHATNVWLARPGDAGTGASLWANLPWATIVVNLSGCLLIGLLLGDASTTQLAGNTKALLVTGLLGGFTTFSAFGYETLQLLRAEPLWAVAVVTLQVIGGVALVAVGMGLRGHLAS